MYQFWICIGNIYIYIYILPSLSVDTYELFFEYLEQTNHHQLKNVLTFGDFNAPEFIKVSKLIILKDNKLLDLVSNDMKSLVSRDSLS